jgi:hypothetical protein
MIEMPHLIVKLIRLDKMTVTYCLKGNHFIYKDAGVKSKSMEKICHGSYSAGSQGAYINIRPSRFQNEKHYQG